MAIAAEIVFKDAQIATPREGEKVDEGHQPEWWTYHVTKLDRSLTHSDTVSEVRESKVEP